MSKILVCDFDGVVVLRSEFIKQAAWPIVFADYADTYRPSFEEAERTFGGGRGGDRFDIIRATLRGLGITEGELEEEVQRRAASFDAYVQSEILKEGVPEATRESLGQLATRVPIYLNSATPVTALATTVHNLQLDGYFTELLGRPNTKPENLAKAAGVESVAPSDIVFLGDSDSDYRAAQAFGCAFVGLSNEWNHWTEDKPFPVIQTFSQIVEFC